MAAEGEHGQGDECFWGSESERDPGEQADFGVGRFDQSLGEPVFEGGVDRVAVFDDLAGQLDEGRDTAAPRPGDPPVQGLFSFLSFDGEDMAQAFFEQIGAVQSGIGLGDPGQLVVLAFGEVLGVLPQGVAGTLEPAGSFPGRPGCGVPGRPAPPPAGFGAGQGTGVVPGPAPFGVQGFGGPGHHMERISAQHRSRAAFSDDRGDPLGGIGRDVGDLGGSLVPEGVEEPPQGGFVAARGGPQQPSGVVVDNDREVLVVAFVGDLVDTDTAQTGEAVHSVLGVGPDPGHDRPDGAPGDPHQLAHRGFRAGHRQPGHRRVEGQGVPGPVPRPGHRDHRRPVLRAVHPRSVGLQHDLHGAPVQTPPPAGSLPAVVPRRPPPTATTTP